MRRQYLYGITQSANPVTLDVRGVDGACPVRLVTHDGLACVVSEYAAAELAALPKDQLVHRLLAHQQVLEHVMRQSPVLPVKFGTVLGTSGEVQALMAQRRLELSRALAALRDRVELEVAASWDIHRVLQEIGCEEEIVRLRDSLRRQGRTSREDRVLLGQAVKACMDRRREAHHECMVTLLRPLALDMTTNPLIAEEMVMNVAFLLERSRQQEFEARVHELDGLFKGAMQFRMIGPLPPYSFSTLEVTRVTPQQLAEAQEVLRLGNTFTEPDVRRTYRRLAAAAQRNLKPGDAPVRDSCARLRAASALLLNYCRAQGDGAGSREDPGQEQDAGCLFLVALRRSGDPHPLPPPHVRGRAGEGVQAARFGGEASAWEA